MTSLLTRPLLALLATALLAQGCSSNSDPSTITDPNASATSTVPLVTLPPDALLEQVPRPDEVPVGMVPILKGSGSRTITVVAGYSGTGAAAKTAEARLRAHHFVGAYVAQFANPATNQVLSIVVSRFTTGAFAAADFSDDLKGSQGKTVAVPQLGEQSAVTTQSLTGKPVQDLVLVRFRRGTLTWSLAYKAAAPADPEVAVGLATRLLARAPAA